MNVGMAPGQTDYLYLALLLFVFLLLSYNCKCHWCETKQPPILKNILCCFSCFLFCFSLCCRSRPSLENDASEIPTAPSWTKAQRGLYCRCWITGLALSGFSKLDHCAQGLCFPDWDCPLCAQIRFDIDSPGPTLLCFTVSTKCSVCLVFDDISGAVAVQIESGNCCHCCRQHCQPVTAADDGMALYSLYRKHRKTTQSYSHVNFWMAHKLVSRRINLINLQSAIVH